MEEASFRYVLLICRVLTFIINLYRGFSKAVTISQKQTFTVITLKFHFKLKGALLGLRQFLGTENPLKMMENAFYLT